MDIGVDWGVERSIGSAIAIIDTASFEMTQITMKLVSLSAYFDGETIQLEEPYPLEPNAKLIVTVLSESDPEGDSWLAWSRHQLDHAYSEEDDYPLDAIKAVNPEYEGS